MYRFTIDAELCNKNSVSPIRAPLERLMCEDGQLLQAAVLRQRLPLLSP